MTSALDPKTEAEICRNVQKLEGAYTIIAITHREAWTEVATRLYRLEYGRLTKIAKSRSMPQAV